MPTADARSCAVSASSAGAVRWFQQLQHLFVARTQLLKICGDLIGRQEPERLIEQRAIEPERRSIVTIDRDRGARRGYPLSGTASCRQVAAVIALNSVA